MAKKAGTKNKKESGKSKKIKKDPNAPKKGMTAFLHYVQANLEQYKKEHPGLAHKEVIGKLGEAWKTISASEKAPFEAKAKAQKEQYDKAKAAYDAKNKESRKKSESHGK